MIMILNHDLDNICLESEKQNNLWELKDLSLKRDHKLLNH